VTAPVQIPLSQRGSQHQTKKDAAVTVLVHVGHSEDATQLFAAAHSFDRCWG